LPSFSHEQLSKAGRPQDASPAISIFSDFELFPKISKTFSRSNESGVTGDYYAAHARELILPRSKQNLNQTTAREAQIKNN
jgi:hypothetical protein